MTTYQRVTYLLVSLMLFYNNINSQIFIKPCVQASLWEQSLGVMAGYSFRDKIELAINSQFGNNYKELSLYSKYTLSTSSVFNIGISVKGGYVNDCPRLFFPALEQSWHFRKTSLELGLRPTNRGLLFIEPRFKILF